jgi:hypothetical protein
VFYPFFLDFAVDKLSIPIFRIFFTWRNNDTLLVYSSYTTTMTEPTTSASTSPSPSSADANTKIMMDLQSVNEKIDILRSMLHPANGAPKLSIHNDAIKAVVGFLEACQPRLIELVEAASISGVLSEQVFEEVLQCNDRLQKILSEDVETAALTETTAETTVAKAPDVTDQFDDLLLGDLAESTPAAAAGGVGVKTTGEDISSSDMKQPATIPTSSSNDEFDAFFAERQGN